MRCSCTLVCGFAYAPVAQLDRALACGAKGHRFKSCRVYQICNKSKKSHFRDSFLYSGIIQKSNEPEEGSICTWRRERDSNPRSLAAYRFSRAASSTTPAPLQSDYYNKLLKFATDFDKFFAQTFAIANHLGN